MNEQQMKEILGLKYFPNLYIYNIDKDIGDKWVEVVLRDSQQKVCIPHYKYNSLEKITRDIINCIAAACSDGTFKLVDKITTHLFIQDIDGGYEMGILCNYDGKLSRLDETLFTLVSVGDMEPLELS